MRCWFRNADLPFPIVLLRIRDRARVGMPPIIEITFATASEAVAFRLLVA
jgi:hypothetical protein